MSRCPKCGNRAFTASGVSFMVSGQPETYQSATVYRCCGCGERLEMTDQGLTRMQPPTVLGTESEDAL